MVLLVLKRTGITLLILIFLAGNSYLLKSTKAAIDLDGDTVLLMEMENGQVLYENNMHKKKYPASTTKILTALLLLQNSSLSEEVKVTENAYRVSGSTLHLNIGTTVSVRDLLYGIMLRSANDGAVAAAEHVSGSVENFTNKMNSKAKELGARNSNFENPHGLSNGYPEHKTTAYDLGLISREALKCPVFRKIVQTKKEVIFLEDGERGLYNLNRLMDNYEGANGVKTGYTSKSGYTLVASATREDITLIAVVLGSCTRDSLFNDAKKLLNYGFDNFEKVNLVESGELIDSVGIDYGIELDIYSNQEINYMINTKDSVDSIEEKNELTKSWSFPLEANDKVGSMHLVKEGEKIGETDLIIKENIKRPLSSYVTNAKNIYLAAGIIITGFFIILKLKNKTRK